MLLPGDILPIGTVSVVESFNLRGILTFFLLVDVRRLWRWGKGGSAGFIVGNWRGFFPRLRAFDLGGLVADQVPC